MSNVVTYIYGPVKSWRSGTSLGIDPIGDVSTCSFNCAYCQLGQIQNRTAEIKTYVPTAKILADFARALEVGEFRLEDLDVITFAGSGEPTLALNLAEMIDGIRNLMYERGVSVPISILTNATLFNNDDVCFRALKADLISLKLDAPNDEVLRSINQPVEGVTVESIISGIKNLQRIQYELGDCHGSQSEPRNDGVSPRDDIADLQMQIMLMPKFLKSSLRAKRGNSVELGDCFADARNDKSDARNDGVGAQDDTADDYVTQLAKIVKDLGIKKIQINTPTRPKPVSKTGEYWIETRGNHYSQPALGDCFANARNDEETPDYIEFKELPVITKEQAREIEKTFREVINDPQLEIINVYQ